MYKLMIGIIMSVLTFDAMSASSVQVFVSFSMPNQLLSAVLTESARLQIPAILNGLIDNSMPKTVQRIQQLSKIVPNLNLQIDPTAFERFGIKQVPALVVDNGKEFDVLYSNVSIQEGLLKMAGHGDSGLLMIDVRRIIGG
jgi:conjugal transfer pilus assembly protein TrbC